MSCRWVYALVSHAGSAMTSKDAKHESERFFTLSWAGSSFNRYSGQALRRVSRKVRRRLNPSQRASKASHPILCVASANPEDQIKPHLPFERRDVGESLDLNCLHSLLDPLPPTSPIGSSTFSEGVWRHCYVGLEAPSPPASLHEFTGIPPRCFSPLASRMQNFKGKSGRLPAASPQVKKSREVPGPSKSVSIYSPLAVTRGVH